jgi:LysR family glycine cleavage system transcriptional activator
VAQQVRALEAATGVALVRREGRALALTPEGERLAQALSEGFGGIQAALATLRAGGDDGPVRVTLTASFAAQWLMPRLRDFWTRHPEVALSLHPDARVVDLRREAMDLGIRYGNGRWPGVQAQRLASARLVMVAAPALLEGRPPAEVDPAALPWVLGADWPEQENWMRSHGLDRARLAATTVPDETLAMAAARQGLGVTVESLALVENDLRTGTLVLLADWQEALPAFFVVTPDGPLRRPARAFHSWLLRQA